MVAGEGAVWRTREARAAAALAFFVAAVRYLLARPLTFCGTPDACYYLGMAQTLSSGGGFHARFLYDFQQAHLSLPNTGIEYWRPGVSFFLLLMKPFGGVTLHSSIALTILVGIVYAMTAWHIAWRATGDKRLALGSFALCLLSSPAWIGSLSPDSGLYYGAAVGWFLALFTVRRQGWLADLIALGCVSLAYLIRNDAALLLVPLLVVLWRRYQASARARAASQAAASETASAAGSATFADGSSPAYALAVLVGFVLALLPMHLLYRAVLGTALPSGTAQAFFLNDLSDFGRYGDPATLHSLLAFGWKHLLLLRIATLVTVLYRVAALMIGYAALVFLPGLFFEAPVTVKTAGENRVAVALERISGAGQPLPELTGSCAFFVTILFVYSAVLPAIGGFSALRSATAVLPLVAVLTMVAIGRVARTPWIAAALATAVITANAVSGCMDDGRAVSAANRIADADRAEARAILAAGASSQSALILTGDPVQFSVTTGLAAVALPSNGLNAIIQAAHAFKATHVMLDTVDLPATPETLAQRLGAVRSLALPAEHTLILVLASDREHQPSSR